MNLPFENEVLYPTRKESPTTTENERKIIACVKNIDFEIVYEQLNVLFGKGPIEVNGVFIDNNQAFDGLIHLFIKLDNLSD